MRNENPLIQKSSKIATNLQSRAHVYHQLIIAAKTDLILESIARTCKHHTDML